MHIDVNIGERAYEPPPLVLFQEPKGNEGMGILVNALYIAAQAAS
ncbi:hypothetical protein LMG1866_03656 [Achromobacter ruhlandii]|nr:hypothetical protein LMG1866_03656 [Achromobacter ruhlandii]